MTNTSSTERLSPSHFKYSKDRNSSSSSILQNGSVLHSKAKILQNIVSRDDESLSNVILNHCEVMFELRLNFAGSNQEKPEMYENVGKIKPQIWETTRHSSIDNEYRSRNENKVNDWKASIKRKPPPYPPKPKKYDENIYENTDDLRSEAAFPKADITNSIYARMTGNLTKNNNSQNNLAGSTCSSCDDVLNANIYSNAGTSTSRRYKESNSSKESVYDLMPGDAAHMSQYLSALEFRENSILCIGKINPTELYTPMAPRRKRYCAGLSASYDYIDLRKDLNSISIPKPRIRIRSIPNSFQYGERPKMHLRGVRGCRYETAEDEYIYELQPGAFRGSAFPFIRKKVEGPPMPCYCRELNTNFDYKSGSLGDKENNNIAVRDSVGKTIFKPFVYKETTHENEDVSVPPMMERKLTGVIKKKVDQMKKLFFDWSPNN